MTQANKLIASVLFLALSTLAIFAWYQYERAKKYQDQIDLAATSMLHEIFTSKRDLRVGQLSGVIVANSEYKGWVLQPSQQTKAPVTINYLIDLANIRKNDMHFDAKSRRLTVRIPDVSIESPNIDFMRAEVKQKGLWIGRGAGIVMQREAIRRIVDRANQRAQDSKNINHARQQAVEFVSKLVKSPLEAVGYGPVDVEVIAPWNKQASDERWDTTRSLQEVLGNSN